MKRFAPLALIVLALAAVPAALADNGAPSAPPSVTPPATQPAQPANGHPGARIQLELLRIRLQIVRLRYRIACHKQDSDRCATFKQNVVDRLTKLDQNVQGRISTNCTSTSTDKRCDVLTKLDQKLQDVISKLGAVAGSSSSTDSSGLDNAAGALAGGKP